MIEPMDLGVFRELALQLKITTNKGQIGPMSLTPIQEDFFSIINRHEKVICLKSRQVFITTLCLLYILAAAITTPGLRVGLILDNWPKAKEKLGILAGWFHQLGVDLSVETQVELRLRQSGARITCMSAGIGDKIGRGLTYDLVVFSEMGFYEGAKEVWASINPAISIGGKVIIESTSAGPQGLFYQLYNSTSNWVRKFYSIEDQADYQVDPGSISEMVWERYRSEGFSSRPHAAYFHSRLMNDYMGDEARAKQNYPLTEAIAWTSLDDSFIKIPPRIIDYGKNGDFHIFIQPAKPEEHARYIYAYDPSGAKGQDHSAVAILNRYTNQLVATFYNNTIEADQVLTRIQEMTKIYKPDIILVEENGVGSSIIPFARKMGLGVSPVYTDQASKYLNFLNCKRFIESGVIQGDVDLWSEATGLRREVKEEDETGKARWKGKDDLLTAIGIALTFNLKAPIKPPAKPLDPDRYYKIHDQKPRGPKSFLNNRHLL